MRSPCNVELRGRNFRHAGKEVDCGAIEVARVYIVFVVLGSLAQLHECARGPGAARKLSAQIVSHAARLGPLLRAAVGEREIEHRLGALLSGWPRRSIQRRRSFEVFVRVSRRDHSMRLKGRVRAVWKSCEG